MAMQSKATLLCKKHQICGKYSKMLVLIFVYLFLYGVEIWKMPCFDIPIPEDYLIRWRDRYECYRGEMANALSRGDEVKNDAADDVIKKYKQV